jgi:transcriptional regulator with XRE-family HTH domain
MSEQPDTAQLPRWDLADKMRKSLRHAGLGVQDMADYLDVDRSTVSTWINGRIEPDSRTMKLWSLRTGIPYTWFCHGDLRPCDLAPQPKTAGQGRNKRRANNMHYSQTKIAS